MKISEVKSRNEDREGKMKLAESNKGELNTKIEFSDSGSDPEDKQPSTPLKQSNSPASSDIVKKPADNIKETKSKSTLCSDSNKDDVQKNDTEECKNSETEESYKKSNSKICQKQQKEEISDKTSEISEGNHQSKLEKDEESEKPKETEENSSNEDKVKDKKIEILEETESNKDKSKDEEDEMPKEIRDEKPKENEDSSNEEKSQSEEGDSEIIDVDDFDDYLLYLEDILIKLHARFYQLYDERLGDRNNLPDIKTLVVEEKSKVLRGCHIVFSGVVPQRTDLHNSKAYHIATSLGAMVSEKLVVKAKKDNNLESTNFTTHLVAAKLHTEKARQAKKLKNCKVISLLLYMNCTYLFLCEFYGKASKYSFEFFFALNCHKTFS